MVSKKLLLYWFIIKSIVIRFGDGRRGDWLAFND